MVPPPVFLQSAINEILLYHFCNVNRGMYGFLAYCSERSECILKKGQARYEITELTFGSAPFLLHHTLTDTASFCSITPSDDAVLCIPYT